MNLNTTDTVNIQEEDDFSRLPSRNIFLEGLVPSRPIYPPTNSLACIYVKLIYGVKK